MTYDDGRKGIAIGHLSDSGDLKKYIMFTTESESNTIYSSMVKK
jgi:hypothetical protein